LINVTKLLGGSGTISDILKEGYTSHLSDLRFSNIGRPVVAWNITGKCNLKCKHCYLSSPKSSNELSTDEALKLLEEMRYLKIPIVLISGGEPLIRDDIYKIIKYAIDLGLIVGISSNGTLINREVAKRLFSLGVNYVGISLDGASPEVHDSIRGLNNAFNLAMNGIKNCIDIGLKIGIRTLLVKRTLSEVPKVIELALRLGVGRLCLYHLVPTGRAKGFIHEDLSPNDRRKLIDNLYNHIRTLDGEIEILTVCNPADGVYIYLKALEEDFKLANQIYKLLKSMGGCSAGSKIICIGPDGSVYPCQFLNNLPVGNVRTSSLKEIISNNNPSLKLLRDRNRLTGKCGSCKFRDICGGCRARAYYYNGSYFSEDPGCYLTYDETA